MKKIGMISRNVIAVALMGVAHSAWAQAPAADGEAVGDEVVVTGTRTSGFKASDSPAPIQVLGADTLSRVGQSDLIAALSQTLPSVQAQAYGSDQAAFHPSIKLRGLSPNQTLVLLDGKRRHTTSSVNVTGGLFGGAASVDMMIIPEAAIDHIEVLQDGAAAQYGTDAIAGVVNIILKKRDHGGDLAVTGGRYMDQGGQRYDIMGNLGIAPWEGAYFNLTAQHQFRNFSFRGDVDPRVVDTGQNTSANTGPSGGRYMLANFPDVVNAPGYPYVNKIFGDGRLRMTNVLASYGWHITPDIELYGNSSYSRKKGQTVQNYRLPNVAYGKETLSGTGIATNPLNSADIPFPAGFQPYEMTIESDYASTLGLRGELNTINWDVSSTYGINTSNIYVTDSANAVLYYDTSTATSPGYSPSKTLNGIFIASQWTNTFDVSHDFDVGFAAPLNVAGGVEYRREVYQLKSGDEASYYIGSGFLQGGIQSFFGYAPSNASRSIRHNVSEYLDLSTKPVDQLTLDAAIRHEWYDDFGSTTVYKLTGRYDFSDAIAVRGTVSTGFRAPTLAEGNYSGINVNAASLTGIFPSSSAGARALGIAGLKPEKSTNFSAGFVLKPIPRLTVTIDGYWIKIRDRIVRSSSFVGYSSAPGTLTSPSVVTALRDNGVPVDSVIAAINAGATGSVGVNSFVNGASTRTQGIDFLATYASDFGDWGHVDWSLAANYTKTKITKINAAPSNINQAVQVLDVYAQADLTKTTPKYRTTLGAYWTLGKVSVNLRESYYGSAYTIIATPQNGQARERLGISPSFITDLEVGYKLTSMIKLSAGANNLFNKYPNKYAQFIRDQQYAASSTAYITKYPSFSPYGIDGGYYYGRVSLNF